MTFDVEVITWEEQSKTALTLMRALIDAAPKAGIRIHESHRYRALAPWLMVWGVGRAEFMVARNQHMTRGGRMIMWDMGYVGRGKVDAQCRVSIDEFHPWRQFDRTQPDPARWESFGIPLREDANPDGHIVLACLGKKSVKAFGLEGWDDRAYKRLRGRFPGVPIVRREKPHSRYVNIPPIEDVIRGARLVACRHSNCAIDAAIAGIPFECEDGAAYWLQQREFTPDNRIDFLRRLCMWQWTCYEAAQAWEFLKEQMCD